ncbi:leucine zipper domain-containing protein [Streptomyces syringium]|uniref:leucine zipper domain-containing protein n=1 Tax=Streptomyces syringium TaxID=76729 RepID=UPI003452CD3D
MRAGERQRVGPHRRAGRRVPAGYGQAGAQTCTVRFGQSPQNWPDQTPTGPARALEGALLGFGADRIKVARRYGTSRQSPHTWLRRFREDGRDGLRDRSRRPHSSPARVPVEVELAIWQLRQTYPK